MIAAGLLATALAAAPQDLPAPRILYLHGVPADAALFAAARSLGFTAVGGGSFDVGAAAHEDLRFYVDQAVGKGVLELREATWREVRERYRRSRDAADLERPRCLSEPATLAELERGLRARLLADSGQRPLAVALGDEVAVTRHCNPLDLCFAAPSLAAFRAHLRERYASIRELNQMWGTSFGAFERVVPFTADQIRARERVGSELPENLAPWAEHRAFMDEELARAVGRLIAVAGELRPGVPVGLTGMQPPSAYGGHDFGALLRGQTFFEVYDIGGARDLAACLAPRGALQACTVFPPAADVPARLPEAACYDALAHGIGAWIVWSAGEVFGAGGKVSDYGRLLQRVFVESAAAAAAFGGARLRRSPVWLVESQAAVRAHWMLDSAADGETWIERLSSYEAQHSTSLAARHGWLRLLEDVGMQGRLVLAEALGAELRAAPPRLLVLPALVALGDDAVEAIEEYVAGGGRVLADHSLAWYDERLRLRPRPALDALFGLQRPELRAAHALVREGRARGARLASGVGIGEAGLGGAVAEPAGEQHAVHFEQGAGRGRAVFLNLAVCEYGRLRLDEAAAPAARDLRARVRRVLGEAGVQPPFLTRAEGLPTCIEQLVLEARDGRELIAVRVNALESPPLMARLGERGARPVELAFARRIALRDLLTGREHAPAERFAFELDPWRGLFLEVREAR